MKSGQVALSTSATKIIAAEPLTRNVVLHVITSATIYVGDGTVTTSNGFKIDNAAGPVAITIPPNEELFGIVASGTPTVSYLVPGD
jgi:hypothetical protein